MDSGIDYDHPDLGGCFGPGCRVEKGFDLVGDAFNADSTSPRFSPTPVPDPLPDDCRGHGTHVSGIIGANGSIRGVAPDVTFHAYRVFGCDGPTTADILLAAMEQVLDDGADVLNMSIGIAFQWPQYPTSKAASRLVKHGVVVVASIGNEGSFGLYGAVSPGVGREVIGVASFDNTHANLVAFLVSPDATKVGYIAASGAPPPPQTGTFSLARTGTVTAVDDGCTPLPAGSLTGKVALIRRGTCSFNAKARNAQAAEAVGIVLYNNVVGFISPTVVPTAPEDVPITIPVVVITAANGALIDSRLAAGSVDMTWTSLITSEPQPTGNLISSFSSYGPAADLSFKPDLGAPGGAIRSTLPLEQDGAGSLSGTSMSSPHVAGAVALLLEARPRAKPDEVQARLQNTARPHLWFGNPSLGFLDVVHRQGAGMLEIDDAILADVVVSPSSLALGEIEAGSATRVLRISKESSRDFDRHRSQHRHDRNGDQLTYMIGHEPALATGPNTFTPQFLNSFASVQFSQPTFTVGGRHGDDAFVVVTITPPPSASAHVFGGYITLAPDDGGTVLRVPYVGYNGDYQAITALTPTAAGFPWLARPVGPNFVNEPQGASFTLEGSDVPFILFHLDHQVRALQMEVTDVVTGRSFGLADDEDFVVRNSGPSSFFGFAWDGTTMKRSGGKARPVPNGTYRIDLSVLKALGDPRNPAHIERWPSPDITIMRPVPSTP
jgi:minor extracellular serine protease Vpr